MRKSLNSLEELKQQLGDTMPVALQIFAKAAQEAGISTTGTTKELFKLMENGLVPAQKIMPFVSRGFSDFANKNDALNVAMSKLNKRFDVTKDSVLNLNEALFGAGVESSLSFLLNGFDDLMKSSGALSTFFGGTFKGAVVAITIPFRLLYDVIYDITNLLGLHNMDKFGKDLLAITGIAVGLAVGVSGLYKSILLLGSLTTLMTTIAGFVGIGAGASATGGLVALAVGGLTTALGVASAVLATAAAAYGVGTAISKGIDKVSPNTNINLGRNITKTMALFNLGDARQMLENERKVGGFTPEYQNLLERFTASQQTSSANKQGVKKEITLHVTHDSPMFDSYVTGIAANEIGKSYMIY